jgi:hypothetical protein
MWVPSLRRAVRSGKAHVNPRPGVRSNRTGQRESRSLGYSLQLPAFWQSARPQGRGR